MRLLRHNLKRTYGFKELFKLPSTLAYNISNFNLLTLALA